MSKKTRHESFGMIKITRVNSNRRRPLFGSSIGVSNTIEISIDTAECERNLNREWYKSKENIITVEMSPSQFAELITNMNTQGVPCTLRRIQGERFDDPPFEIKRDTFSKEFKRDLNEIMQTVGQAISDTKEALQQRTVRKKDLKSVLSELEKIKRDLFANLPFVEKSFQEQMDRSVTEAKVEVEGFFDSKIRSLGSAKLVEALEKSLLNNITLLMDGENKGGKCND